MTDAMDVSDTAGDTTITIRCLQGWKGAVTVSPSATLNGFLTALNTAADLRDGDVLSLIIKGRRCDPSASAGNRDKPLASLGVVDGAAIMLIIRSPEERAKLAAHEARVQKLREVERAADALSARVGIEGTDADYGLSITNQVCTSYFLLLTSSFFLLPT